MAGRRRGVTVEGKERERERERTYSRDAREEWVAHLRSSRRHTSSFAHSYVRTSLLRVSLLHLDYLLFLFKSAHTGHLRQGSNASHPSIHWIRINANDERSVASRRLRHAKWTNIVNKNKTKVKGIFQKPPKNSIQLMSNCTYIESDEWRWKDPALDPQPAVLMERTCCPATKLFSSFEILGRPRRGMHIFFFFAI